MPVADRRPSQLSYLLVVCALVIGATSLMRAWFSAHGVSVGLWGIESCSSGCHGTRWDDVGGTDFDIIVAGYVGTVAGVLAALTMAMVGTLAAGSSGERGPLPAARTLLNLALAASAYFVIRFLIDGNLGLDWAAVVGPAAMIAGVVLLRRISPPRTDPSVRARMKG